MVGAEMAGLRTQVRRGIRAAQHCRALCERVRVRLAHEGQDARAAERERLLRACAEACERHARSLARDRQGVRRTAALCYEWCARLAHEAWQDGRLEGQLLALSALRVARGCRLLLSGA